MPITDADAIKIMQAVLGAKLGRSDITVAQSLQHSAALTNTDATAIAAAVLSAVPAGSPGFTVAALAKAINDDAAKRMAS